VVRELSYARGGGEGMAIGDEIRKAREAMGWTSRQLAQAIKSQVPTVRAWEEGCGAPSAEMLNRIARVTGHEVRLVRKEQGD
jgi:ribosome-binding protein aMBF1 (putative translation factor)